MSKVIIFHIACCVSASIIGDDQKRSSCSKKMTKKSEKNEKMSKNVKKSEKNEKSCATTRQTRGFQGPAGQAQWAGLGIL